MEDFRRNQTHSGNYEQVIKMMIGCKDKGVVVSRGIANKSGPKIDPIEFKGEPVEVPDNVGKWLIENSPNQYFEVKGEVKVPEVKTVDKSKLK